MGSCWMDRRMITTGPSPVGRPETPGHPTDRTGQRTALVTLVGSPWSVNLSVPRDVLRTTSGTRPGSARWPPAARLDGSGSHDDDPCTGHAPAEGSGTDPHLHRLPAASRE